MSPAPNASSAARTSPVAVTFSQPLTAASAAALKVFGTQRSGLRSRGTSPAMVSGSTLSFTPSVHPYAPGETVYYTVTTAAGSVGGSLARSRVGQFKAATGGTGIGSFNSLTASAVGASPGRMAVGDVDGDGDLDLVTSNYASGVTNSTLSVRQNGGDASGSNTGVFGGGQTIAVGIAPSGLALADVDGDGDLDLLAANSANHTVSVRVNGGTNSGNFSGTQNVAVGSRPGSLVVGDVDGDGDLDFLTTSDTGAVSVCLNNGSGTFSAGGATAAGSTSSGLALGDVDGDGDLDLLVAGYSSHAVGVHLNGGNATGSNTGVFTGGTTVSVGRYPTSVTLGDVDADGDLDFVTANSEAGTVSVRLNDGSGQFSAGQTVTVQANPRNAELADVDADGDLDLAVSNFDDQTVSIRLNGGSGQFGGGSDVAAGTSPLSIALADVDGDDDVDLLVTNYTSSGTVSVLRNRATAAPIVTSFSPASGAVGSSITITGTSLVGTTNVNFGGAGPATILSNTATSLSVRVPTGAVTGPISVTTPSGTGASAAAFQVLPTLSSFSPASSPAGAVLTLTGTGLSGATAITFAGTSANVVTSNFTVNTNGTQISNVVVPGGAASGPVTVTTAGGTSNAVSFIVTVLTPTLTNISHTSGPQGATVSLLGTGLTNASVITFAGTGNNVVTTGFAVPTSTTITEVVVPAGAVTGPVTVTTPGGTSNGVPFTLTLDLIITGVSPALNTRNATATSPVHVTFNKPPTVASAAALRVFGSQRGGLRTRAVAAVVSGNTMTYTPPAAKPYLPGETVYYTVAKPVSSPGAIALAQPRVGQFTVATGGTGRGVFTGLQRLAGGVQPCAVVTADVDGDGDLDLLSGGYSNGGGVGVHLNGGDDSGSNTGIFGRGTGVSTGAFPQSLAAGDLDGDGDIDMVAASFINTTGMTPLSVVSVRLNGGNNLGTNTGVFTGGSEVPVGDGPLGVALGDIDGDGDLDMVTANAGVGTNYGNGSTVSVRLNNGSGAFSASQTVSVGQGPMGVALGDIDHDGDLDICTANYTAGTVSIRLNGGDRTGSNTGLFSNGSTITVGAQPVSIALGDLDGDGDLDIVTANKNTPGTVSVRLNGGFGLIVGSSEVSVYSEPAGVVLGDVDADGDLDICTATYAGASGNTVSIRLNGGDATGSNTGTFAGGFNPTVGSTPAGLTLGDWDGDGDLDLATANRFDGEIGIRMNRAPNEPTVTFFSPSAGPVGASIVISGTNLAGATAVSFNGAVQTVITGNTSTSLTVRVPAGATTGLVSVTTPAGVGVSTLPFSVMPTPVLTSISPTSGSMNSPVTLTGTGLQSVFSVNFAGTANNTVLSNSGFVISPDGTQISGILVPSGAVTGNVTVTAPGGTSNGVSFAVLNPQLAVTQGNTSYASGGAIYDYGTQPLGSSSTTTFTLTNNGPVPLALTSVTPVGDFALSGPAPTQVAAGGTATVTVAFTPTAVGAHSGYLRLRSVLGAYIVNLSGTGQYPSPVISGLTPLSGPVGTMVTVTGQGFVVGSTTVTLNGAAVSAVTVSSSGTTLTFTIPAGATTGVVMVTTPGGSARSQSILCVQYRPGATTVSRCGVGAVTLTASGAPGGGTYQWYNVATGGTALASGVSYTTGTLSATTTYFVAIGTGSGAEYCEGGRTAVTAIISPEPATSITPNGPTTFCTGGSVTLMASGASTYRWSTGQTTASIVVATNGAYSVIGTSAAGCTATSTALTVTVNSPPSQPVVSVATGGVLTSSSATGNQWYLNGSPIPGATGATHTATSSGLYTVVVTSPAGCTSPPSGGQSVVVTRTTAAQGAGQLQLFPNPAQQVCTVRLPAIAGQQTGQLVLQNPLGQTVRRCTTTLPAQLSLSLVGLSQGMYIVQLQAGTTVITKRLVVESE